MPQEDLSKLKIDKSVKKSATTSRRKKPFIIAALVILLIHWCRPLSARRDRSDEHGGCDNRFDGLSRPVFIRIERQRLYRRPAQGGGGL